MLNLSHKYLRLLMWFLPLSFFTFQFILRLWPGLMINQIMGQYSINASEFGILAACYYYGYSLTQLPLAILLERFGYKYIVSFGAIMCGIAAIGFTYTNNFYIAALARCVIGAGSAVGFLGVSKVVSEWFPDDQYARMIGFSFTIGLMGAVFGGKPISLLIDSYSWHSVASVLAIVSITIGVFSYLILYSPKTNNRMQSSEKFEITSVVTTLSSRVIWMLAIANLLMVGVLEGFADVWGVQYLMIAYDISKADAAALTSIIFFGMLVGGPFLAYLSKSFGNYNVIAMCGIVIAAAFSIILLNPEFNQILLACLFFVIGSMCCYQVIVFATGADLVDKQQLGVIIAFLNCINMLGGSFFHTAIGKIMDLFWMGEVSPEGVRLYDLETYKYALSIIPICALIGTILIIFVKTHREKIQ